MIDRRSQHDTRAEVRRLRRDFRLFTGHMIAAMHNVANVQIKTRDDVRRETSATRKVVYNAIADRYALTNSSYRDQPLPMRFKLIE